MNNTITYYNKFEYPFFLIFLIDTKDVITLQNIFSRIYQIFNSLLILDSSEYYMIGYYLMPYENHFVVLFKSEYSDEFIQKDKWYLFDNLQDIIFEINGDKDKILSKFGIHAIIYKKL